MVKINKRIERSYNAYLNFRSKHKASGYGLDRELTLQEYAAAHADYAHAHANDPKSKHIARGIAGLERTFTKSEANAIIRRLNNAQDFESDVDIFELEVLRHKYKKARDIYGLELYPEEMQANEAMRRQRILERGKAPEYTIQANARSLLFNQLRDAGLSYKEAEAVLYG